MHLLGPCIPNFYLKFRVEFQVGTSFRESRWDESNVIFLLFSVILVKGYYRNSQKRKIAIFAIFAIFANFASSEMFGKHRNYRNYRNISEIQKTAISETRENKNFGKNIFRRALASIYHIGLQSFITYFGFAQSR